MSEKVEYEDINYDYLYEDEYYADPEDDFYLDPDFWNSLARRNEAFSDYINYINKERLEEDQENEQLKLFE